MKVFLVLSGLIIGLQAASNQDNYLNDWNTFKLAHGKSYSSNSEEKNRMHVFMENMLKINNHNEKYDKGEVSYRLATNKYADMSHDEFLAEMTGLKNPLSPRKLSATDDDDDGAEIYVPPTNPKLAKWVDWRKKGAVTPVKDQGKCGCCWAFTVVGSLEGQLFRKTGNLVSLSEQNLLDCSRLEYGNDGCDGGNLDSTFQFIKDNNGIETECDYPYKAKGGRCQYKSDTSGVNVTGYVDIPFGDEYALKCAVATVGPISSTLDASHESFQLYGSGIYYEPACNSTALDHAIVVVGYGTDENGIDYWLVKNSWGTSWGEKGYFRIVRDKENHCGIASGPVFPLVARHDRSRSEVPSCLINKPSTHGHIYNHTHFHHH